MGKDMAATDNAFGFECYGPVLRQNLYVVTTAPTLNFFHNDMVHFTGGGGNSITTPHGYMPIIADDDVITADDIIIGSVLSVMDENMNPLLYMAAGRVGAGSIAGYLMVADHPQQKYVAQEDADGNAITATEGTTNAEIFPPTVNLGNTSTGRSKMEIDSTSAANTATLHLRLMRPHPDDIPHVDGTWARYICMINDHQWGNVGQTGARSAG